MMIGLDWGRLGGGKRDDRNQLAILLMGRKYDYVPYFDHFWFDHSSEITTDNLAGTGLIFKGHMFSLRD